ncbi:MAG: hypothetical protein HDQ44_04085 [Desulfovibrio sp.]|nr:hypothetical protein [Desulfovibrio sp.]
MGKVLQIRVIAVTWDKERIEEYWPRVAELAFSVPVKLADHGVLEMVRALSEGLEFAKWPEARKKALGPGIRKCAAIRDDLEKALADWQPGRANELSDQLEDCLDELERSFV